MNSSEIYQIVFGDSVKPYAWQLDFASGEWPEVLVAPTGSGKTAGVTLGWIAHRLNSATSTPRRLVWCLPMRTLVEQTEKVVRGWLKKLEDAGVDRSGAIPGLDDVHVLMGGVEAARWLDTPEKPAIMIGTQDMLLSRALMRGYASSRAIWPMEFALLHSDTQWVFDEVQLMGAGKATSTQLEAFRRNEADRRMEDSTSENGYYPARSLWISATLKPEWLKTVDFPVPEEGKIINVDSQASGDSRLERLTKARKNLNKAQVVPLSSKSDELKDYINELSDLILEKHCTGQLTLVIVNRVSRAQEIYAQLMEKTKENEQSKPKPRLIHSRFRAQERRKLNSILEESENKDLIVVATQAVEAGVDISATVMFSELAPWSSMVQRFGRANRYGNLAAGADIFWINLTEELYKEAQKIAQTYELEIKDCKEILLPKLEKLLDPEEILSPMLGKLLSEFKKLVFARDFRFSRLMKILDDMKIIIPELMKDKAFGAIKKQLSELKKSSSELQKSLTKSYKEVEELALPYSVEELEEAEAHLSKLADVAPVNLPDIGEIDQDSWVIREKDLYGLFDTDPDLTGFDIDISSYIRDVGRTDVRIFWRDLTEASDKLVSPRAEELCSAPIGVTRDWLSKARKKFDEPIAYIRDPQWKQDDARKGIILTGWKPFREDPQPGQTILVSVKAGGYDKYLGFTGNLKDTLSVSLNSNQYASISAGGETEGLSEDFRSEIGVPVKLSDHLGHVALEAKKLCQLLEIDEKTSVEIIRAARWHDLGKAHCVFQKTMRRGLNEPNNFPEDILLAKTEKKKLRHERSYFRHELASALAFLAQEDWSRDADLVAYLIAAHHGKVRMNIRALPREKPPKLHEDSNLPGSEELYKQRYARGVLEGDELQEFNLGAGNSWEGGKLNLSIMELGRDELTGESWSERTQELLKRLGPFQLAWLETLVRIADWRASEKESRMEYGNV